MRWRHAPAIGAVAAALCGALTAVGCDSCGGGAADGDSAPDASSPGPAGGDAGRVVLDILAELPRCDLDHRGLAVDFGTDAILGRVGGPLGEPHRIPTVEHSGATWGQIFDKTLRVQVALREPSQVLVGARVKGFKAKSALVEIDGQPLGTLRFTRGEIKVANTPTTTLPVDAGPHELTFRFTGSSRPEDTPQVEIDWIRLGVPDEREATYGAPTLTDAVNERAALGGVPHAALALRAPGAVRCAVRVPTKGRLRTAVGVLGAGEAMAEVRLLRDDGDAVTLHHELYVGGDKATWRDLDLDLDGFAGNIVELELRATSGTESGRLLFGDPAVVVPTAPPPPVKRTRAAIVVVLDGVSRAELPPWSRHPTPHLPTLSRLAQEATPFDAHRGPSTVVQSSIATLLTGRLPRAHTVEDAGARLPGAVPQIGRLAHEASIHSGFFTGVPASFPAFGFSEGWERYVVHSPVSGVSTTAPIADAASWVVEVAKGDPDARVLLVVHARGGHPPWPVTDKELAVLPPEDYTGPIKPRTSAQVIATMRKKRRRSFDSADAERMQALHAVSLARQDQAIAELVDALETAGLWDEALFVVTADVGTSVDELFEEGGELAERALELPLYVSFPDGTFGGERVAMPTKVPDLTKTVLLALGIKPPPEVRGTDLASVASGMSTVGQSLQVATRAGEYSARWGELVLRGAAGDSTPTLCDLRVDPTCAFDRSAVQPIAAQAILRKLSALDEAIAAPTSEREPATIDDDVAAALKVWGSSE